MLKTMVLAVVLCGLTGIAPPLEAVEAASIELRGRVVDEDERPLEGVTLELVENDSRRQRILRWLKGEEQGVVTRSQSDAEGWYRVVVPEEGFYRLRARQEGRLTPVFDISPILESRDLPRLRLPKLKAMKITVKDPEGMPVEGAWVWVMGQSLPSSGGSAWGWYLLPQRVRTGPRGEALAERSSPKPVSVRAWAYPFGETKKKSGSVVELRLEPGQGRFLEIVDERNRPVEGAVGALGEAGFPLGPSDDGGKLSLSGRFEGPSLVLFPRDGIPRTQALAVNLRKTVPETWVVETPIEFQGKVVDIEDGGNLEGAFVELIQESGVPGQRARTDRGGFRLQTTAQDGELRVSAKGYLNGYLRIRPWEGEIAPVSLALHPSEILRGRVEGPEGQPVVGARVIAHIRGDRVRHLPPALQQVAWRTRMALTDHDGNFCLGNLVPDLEYELVVRHSHWAETKKTVASKNGFIPSEVLLVMGKGDSAEGVVQNSAGAPIADVRLSLSLSPEGRGRAPKPFASTRTDSEGRYRWSLLPEGWFDLELRASGYAPKTIRRLRAKSPCGVGWDPVVMEAGARLEGRVVDLEGVGLEGVAIFLNESKGGRGFFSFDKRDGPIAFSRLDGAFAIEDLAPGRRIRLSLEREGYGPTFVEELNVSQEKSPEITLAPGSRIEGRVVDEEGEPLVGARVSLTTIGGGGSYIGPGDHVVSAADGTFSFTARAPGDYEVSARARGFQPVELRGFQLPPGGDLEGLEVVMKQGYFLDGVLRNEDGEPVDGATVRAGPANIRGSSSMDQTAGGGRFHLEGLALGPLMISVEHPDYPRFEQSLEIREVQEEVEWVVSHGFTVAGRVLSDSGAPLVGARVRVSRPQTSMGEKETLTGNDGRFEMEGISPGEWRLQARSKGYATMAMGRALVIQDRSITDLEMRLPVGARLHVRVRGLSKEERSGLRVSVSARGPDSVGHHRLSMDSSGFFRATNLGPGEWSLSAFAEGRSKSTSFTLSPGEAEVFQELEFIEGLTLTGVVLSEARPLGGLWIEVQGWDAQDGGSAMVDADGEFAVKGLETGRYFLRVLAPGGEELFAEKMAFSSDHHLEIHLEEAGRISGFVTDSETGEALSSLTVMISRSEPGDLGRSGIHWSQTDSSGYYFFHQVTEGSWLLTVVAADYKTLELGVEMNSGEIQDHVHLEMKRGAVMRVHFFTPTGIFPGSAFLTRLGAKGPSRGLTVQRQLHDGVLDLTGFPQESSTFLVQVLGFGPAEVTLGPDEEPVVVLSPEATLQLRIPDLGEGATEAKAKLVSPTGASLRWLTFPRGATDEKTVHRGAATFDSIPPGPWRVEVRGDDGREWVEEFVAVAGRSHEVVMR